MLSQLPPQVRNAAATAESVWFLAGRTGEHEPLRDVAISTTPFRVGRRTDLEFCLPAASVSKVHAEIISVGTELFLRDLNSTNGTFLNGQRIQHDCPVGEGDSVRFAEIAFRVGRQQVQRIDKTISANAFEDFGLLARFDNLLTESKVVPFFQPIVSLARSTTVGFEALARSTVKGLENPRELFLTASRMQLEEELSTLCRRQAIVTARAFPESPNIFLNTHPAEKLMGGVLHSLRELRQMSPCQPITLELHEAAVTDPHEMSEFRAALHEIDVRLAYDDFGAGQARLLDLAKVPPDYLKFDIGLIRGIHKAPTQQLRMVATLVEMVKDFGTATLAEGVECREEAEACEQLGFEYAQGYFFGKPAPVEALLWCQAPG